MQCYFFIYMNLEQKMARNTTTQIADRRLCTEMSTIRDLQDNEETSKNSQGQAISRLFD